jgi:hypothetical protein
VSGNAQAPGYMFRDFRYSGQHGRSRNRTIQGTATGGSLDVSDCDLALTLNQPKAVLPTLVPPKFGIIFLVRSDSEQLILGLLFSFPV